MYKIFKKFITPDSFENDAYGYVINHVALTVLGSLAMIMVVGIYYNLFSDGVYPNQVPFVFGTLFGYMLLWELGVQGWRGVDTLEDFMYFGMGVCFWLIIDMSAVINILLAWCFVFCVLVSIGVFRRLPKPS